MFSRFSEKIYIFRRNISREKGKCFLYLVHQQRESFPSFCVTIVQPMLTIQTATLFGDRAKKQFHNRIFRRSNPLNDEENINRRCTVTGWEWAFLSQKPGAVETLTQLFKDGKDEEAKEFAENPDNSIAVTPVFIISTVGKNNKPSANNDFDGVTIFKSWFKTKKDFQGTEFKMKGPLADAYHRNCSKNFATVDEFCDAVVNEVKGKILYNFPEKCYSDSTHYTMVYNLLENPATLPKTE